MSGITWEYRIDRRAHDRTAHVRPEELELFTLWTGCRIDDGQAEPGPLHVHRLEGALDRAHASLEIVQDPRLPAHHWHLADGILRPLEIPDELTTTRNTGG